MFAVFLKFFHTVDGDPQWWHDSRTSISAESARNLLETITENDEAPLPSDAEPPWPSAKRHTIDRERDEEEDFKDCSRNPLHKFTTYRKKRMEMNDWNLLCEISEKLSLK